MAKATWYTSTEKFGWFVGPSSYFDTTDDTAAGTASENMFSYAGTTARWMIVARKLPLGSALADGTLISKLPFILAGLKFKLYNCSADGASTSAQVSAIKVGLATKSGTTLTLLGADGAAGSLTSIDLPTFNGAGAITPVAAGDNTGATDGLGLTYTFPNATAVSGGLYLVIAVSIAASGTSRTPTIVVAGSLSDVYTADYQWSQAGEPSGTLTTGTIKAPTLVQATIRTANRSVMRSNTPANGAVVETPYRTSNGNTTRTKLGTWFTKLEGLVHADTQYSQLRWARFYNTGSQSVKYHTFDLGMRWTAGKDTGYNGTDIATKDTIAFNSGTSTNFRVPLNNATRETGDSIDALIAMGFNPGTGGELYGMWWQNQTHGQGGVNRGYLCTQRLALRASTTMSGTFTIQVEQETPASVTFHSTFATLLSRIQTALDGRTSGTTTNKIVVGGTSLSDIRLHFTGSAYSGRTIGPVKVDISSLTNALSYNVDYFSTGFDTHEQPAKQQNRVTFDYWQSLFALRTDMVGTDINGDGSTGEADGLWHREIGNTPQWANGAQALHFWYIVVATTGTIGAVEVGNQPMILLGDSQTSRDVDLTARGDGFGIRVARALGHPYWNAGIGSNPFSTVYWDNSTAAHRRYCNPTIGAGELCQIPDAVLTIAGIGLNDLVRVFAPPGFVEGVSQEKDCAFVLEAMINAFVRIRKSLDRTTYDMPFQKVLMWGVPPCDSYIVGGNTGGTATRYTNPVLEQWNAFLADQAYFMGCPFYDPWLDGVKAGTKDYDYSTDFPELEATYSLEVSAPYMHWDFSDSKSTGKVPALIDKMVAAFRSGIVQPKGPDESVPAGSGGSLFPVSGGLGLG
jgi:hypothetical protein